MQCVLIYMYINTHILSLLKILFLKQKCFACLSSSQHTPLTNHFLIKVQNKTARIDSTYRSQVESVFQRGSTLQLRQLQTSFLPLKICQQVLPLSAVSVFFRVTAKAMQHFSVIYLIMVITKVCLLVSGGKDTGKKGQNICQIFILCNQGDIT